MQKGGNGRAYRPLVPLADYRPCSLVISSRCLIDQRSISFVPASASYHHCLSIDCRRYRSNNGEIFKTANTIVSVRWPVISLRPFVSIVIFETCHATKSAFYEKRDTIINAAFQRPALREKLAVCSLAVLYLFICLGRGLTQLIHKVGRTIESINNLSPAGICIS